MPQTQTAQVAVYDFGAPVAIGTVLQFRARQGGKLDIKFENPAPSSVPFIATLQVSADGITWADTSATSNGEAVAAVSVPPRESKEFTVILRADKDRHFRLRASGGTRGQVQIRPDSILEIVAI